MKGLKEYSCDTIQQEEILGKQTQQYLHSTSIIHSCSIILLAVVIVVLEGVLGN